MKERADKVLADKGLVASRSQAKSLIENGDVTVNGVVIKKAGELIDPEAAIEVTSVQFVGRGALKLEKALTEFNVLVQDKVFMDVGASTGGFTEVLLNHGARRVFAIDVGHDQLAQKLRDDARVLNLEGTNIRELTELPELADGAVMDLSFISITKVLDAVKNLLKPGAVLIALVKPQFEAGRERLPKDNVIKDPKVQKEVLDEVVSFAINHGWIYHGTIDSPIEGKMGNKEFLSWFTRS
ncbi:MAG: TlyA family RNA methyltransferase [Bacteriovoracaceae bacterium]|nr:TlyA family RNA methyltransferase [Bacteriovoracaceae bacterium]